MAPATLTNAQATVLYDRRQAILEGPGRGPWTLTTGTALYTWNATAQLYEREVGGLRVQHRPGTRWSEKRQQFIRCDCRWCAVHPDRVAQTAIHAEPARRGARR
jgi:hypothetical protein